MKYRNLGKYGLKLSEISLGTMYYGSYIKEDQAIKCLDEGVNHRLNVISYE